MLLLLSDGGPIKLPGLKRQPPHVVACTSFQVLHELVCASGGIATMPDFFVRADLDKGTLIQLLPRWNIRKTPLRIVYPGTKNLPRRVRLFIDFAKSEVRAKLRAPTSARPVRAPGAGPSPRR